jgi:hypothetical protein
VLLVAARRWVLAGNNFIFKLPSEKYIVATEQAVVFSISFVKVN